ncbi:MAG: hypothetical protein KJ799_07050 [Bacteroidetes bacterium]|nr:hypothetical protein [Bacteroidota bacterium]MBU1680805.1 hypothetical protein [Bacteroidota bacterium]MBU2506464.1 hypothetical protein [Bacteroidota bacterium]
MRTNFVSMFIIAAFSSVILINCDFTNNPDEEENSENNGFQSAGVSIIFSQNCSTFGCHSGDKPKNGLSLETYDKLITGSNSRSASLAGIYGGEVIIPFNSKKSLLYQMISGGASVSMPFNKSTLSSVDVNVIKNWIDDGAVNYKKEVPFTNSKSYRVFVCNQASDEISVIDGDSKLVSRVVSVDKMYNFNDKPYSINEEGDYYFVTLSASGRFLKINKSDNKIVAELNNLNSPGLIEINGEKAFISRASDSPNIFNSIYVVNTVSMNLIGEISLVTTGIPHAIAIAKGDSKLYAVDKTNNVINIISTIENVTTGYVLLPKVYEPAYARMSPDNKYLYLTADATNELLVVSTQTRNIIFEIKLKGTPSQFVITSDGNKIYIPILSEDIIQVVEKDNESWSVVKEITHTGLSMPHACDITSDDKYVYVSSRNTNGGFVPSYRINGEGNNGTVVIISTETDEVIKLLEIEEYGSGIVVEKI